MCKRTLPTTTSSVTSTTSSSSSSSSPSLTPQSTMTTSPSSISTSTTILSTTTTSSSSTVSTPSTVTSSSTTTSSSSAPSTPSTSSTSTSTTASSTSSTATTPTESSTTTNVEFWIRGGNFEYLLFPEALTFTDAQARCQLFNAHLASITSPQENALVFSLGGTKPFWIGGLATVSRQFFWLDGSRFLYENWVDGEPNNFKKAEDCMRMNSKREKIGQWNDANCGQTSPFVCKRSASTMTTGSSTSTTTQFFIGFDDSTTSVETTTSTPRTVDGLTLTSDGWFSDGVRDYLRVDIDVDFATAEAGCVLRGGSLASISSAEENAKVAAVADGHNVYIGGQPSANKNWFPGQWIDGTAWETDSYTNFAPGEPNDDKGKEACLRMNGRVIPNGMWNDARCTKQNSFFLCEREAANTWVQTGGVEYLLSKDQVKYNDAIKACQALSAELTSVTTNSENKFINNNVRKDATIFLGAKNEAWEDGSTWAFTNFAASVPEDVDSRKNCVIMQDSDAPKWLDSACSKNLHYVCKRPINSR
eukprot:m.275548 g.275548  ORF g.275548 m.275548 type:complete len:532 (+) comp75914_c0_seq1:170-1765(+)